MYFFIKFFTERKGTMTIKYFFLTFSIKFSAIVIIIFCSGDSLSRPSSSSGSQGGFIAFSGIAALAIPAGIVTAGLTARRGTRKDREQDAELDRQQAKDDEHDRLLREHGELLREISEKLSKLSSR